MAGIILPSGRIGVVQLPQIGDGPPRDVVMIHGLGASSGFWYASAVQWFRRFGRVTLFDLPGHGESDLWPSGYTPERLAGVVRELLDHLQISRAHVVAHSFGGVVALAFAARQPHRVKSLILADVRLWAVEPPKATGETAAWVDRFSDAGLTITEWHRDPSVQLLVELARARLHGGDFAEVAAKLPGASRLFAGPRVAQKWLRLIENTTAYEEMTNPAGLAMSDVARIQHPMLTMYGGQSARKRSAFALQRLCQRCQLHMLPNAGHFFPLTRAGQFARPALAFLRSTEGRKVGTHQPPPTVPSLIDLTALEIAA
jgi:pimeloyl-ACP methyl ester carboxylesterase